MELTEIIKAAAERMSKVTVDIDHDMGTVSISDDDGDQEDIFLQGDEATEFIAEVETLYEQAGDVTEDECALSVAEPYVENIWN